MKRLPLGSLLLVAGVALSCKPKNIIQDHPAPVSAAPGSSRQTTFDAGPTVCVEGRYVVPDLKEWTSEPLPTEDCLVRRLSSVEDEGRAVLSICVPSVESGEGGAASSAPRAPSAQRTQVVPLGRNGECHLTGHLTTKEGRVSGDIEFFFVLRDNGTDRLSLRVDRLTPHRLYGLVLALVSASFAPFTKKDEEGFAWQYYSAECRRNRSAVIGSSRLSRSDSVQQSLIRLGMDGLPFH